MMKHSVSRLIKRYIDDSHLRQAVEPNSLQLDVLTVEKGLTQIEDTQKKNDEIELVNDRNLGEYMKKYKPRFRSKFIFVLHTIDTSKQLIKRSEKQWSLLMASNSADWMGNLAF